MSKTADLYKSIEKSLNIYKDDSLEGKDILKYTTVIFRNKAIVCKNKIHSLVLRILGGRIGQVGEKVNTYLKSEAYTGTRLDLANSMLKKNGARTDHQSFKNAFEGLISDYKTLETFAGVDDQNKSDIKKMVRELALKFIESNGYNNNFLEKNKIIDFLKSDEPKKIQSVENNELEKVVPSEINSPEKQVFQLLLEYKILGGPDGNKEIKNEIKEKIDAIKDQNRGGTRELSAFLEDFYLKAT
jgi:hypothetical protein